ncbi:Endonuclease/Exonuclease/phosphatase family protein [Poseidonocella pacifica]|uniref:Endonuclease/Exonuclease/phosphatase family protein n=1 Tax=Poseidonocella pacifica TaxID=871651 RepID=A0A1I0Y2B5_9RHOB|nr:endonuclease/exonuclease/phosphatase family protein [Poseidonocella pacifica]SFB06760.1 Endonuclease/Exonuclease/phosphatase family protein [Poseidonocella pacifica]
MVRLVRTGRLILAVLVAVLGAGTVSATEPPRIRVATYNTGLSRAGPGLLLRDILRGDTQAEAVATIIAHIAPDVIALQGIDYDAEGRALTALAELVELQGVSFPHRFALRPNTGMATGLDLDGDGRTGGPADAQGYGAYAGEGGMAVMSRYPIDVGAVRDLSAILWADVPGADLPQRGGKPFHSPEALSVQRLSTTAHWIVPILLPEGRRFELLTFYATPPVFDGVEDRNGLRNADELRLWAALLDGALAQSPPEGAFVIAGDSNLDAERGDGRREVMRDFLSRGDIVDPTPISAGGADLGAPSATVDWRDVEVGIMRADYVLPSADWVVLDAGVFWPRPGEDDHALLGEGGTGASRHRLVWVDLQLPH